METKKKTVRQRRYDGGGAFPVTYESEDYVKDGMTLRDYFAGQALTGLAGTTSEIASPEAVAIACYLVADAMLKVRRETLYELVEVDDGDE